MRIGWTDDEFQNETYSQSESAIGDDKHGWSYGMFHFIVI